MRFLTKYGWYALLIAIIGDLLIPFILAHFYKGYSNTLMTVSALGNSKSPVRVPFNIWMLIEGILFLVAIPAIYSCYCKVSKILILMTSIFIAVFAVGACIITCFISVNESKDVITTASKIHGAGSVIGFILFLFVPLLLAILSFKGNDTITGIVSVISFILAFVFFVLFILADKPEFSTSIVTKEGLWQRLNLLFMYLPLGYISLKNIYELFK